MFDVSEIETLKEFVSLSGVSDKHRMHKINGENR